MRPPECVDCGREMRSFAAPPDGRVRHIGRGLCSSCYKRHLRNGTHLDFGRTSYAYADIVEDWEELRREGYSRADACERMGIYPRALERALTWKARKEKVSEG